MDESDYAWTLINPTTLQNSSRAQMAENFRENNIPFIPEHMFSPQTNFGQAHSQRSLMDSLEERSKKQAEMDLIFCKEMEELEFTVQQQFQEFVQGQDQFRRTDLGTNDRGNLKNVESSEGRNNQLLVNSNNAVPAQLQVPEVGYQHPDVQEGVSPKSPRAAIIQPVAFESSDEKLDDYLDCPFCNRKYSRTYLTTHVSLSCKAAFATLPLGRNAPRKKKTF